MATYARVSGAVVVEIISTSTQIAKCYAADFILSIVNVTATLPAPQPGWTATQVGGVWTFAAPVEPVADTRPLAKAALDASDLTLLRCFEHGLPCPPEWTAYRVALRAIVSGASSTTPLTTRPAFPAGT